MENFEIIEKLGEGAYSTVFKVKRKIDKQIYALKKVKLSNLKEKEKINSLNEVRILASVKSKYVISYKEAFFDEKDSTLGIVMEFADNGDLYQKIIEHKKKKTFFEESDIWRIFIQLVKGLKSLHDLKILHRDLKSANVFLFKDGHAKLGDLNVSKVAKKGLGYTQTGTPYYASPEVWKDLPYDNKSDIWSLGCVLYEMITLHPPFRARNMEELYKKVIGGEVSRLPSNFSTDLYEVVLLLIQVNSGNRPTCNDILNNSLIKKRIEYFNSMNNKENDGELDEDDKEEQSLLKTILIPKNLLYLSNQLPKPNYNNTKIIIKSNTTTELEVNNINKNIFPNINQDKLTLPNLNRKSNENNKEMISIIMNNDSRSINSNNENLNYNNSNNNLFDIKKEVELYKKLYDNNNNQLRSLKKVNSQNKYNKGQNYNIYNNNNIKHYNLKNSQSNKKYKFYELYNSIGNGGKIKKMPKFKISNNIKNNKNNKFDLYLKNRADLYKGLNKNFGSGKNILPKIIHNNNSCGNILGKNEANNNRINIYENRITQNKNKLNPIIKNFHYRING